MPDLYCTCVTLTVVFWKQTKRNKIREHSWNKNRHLVFLIFKKKNKKTAESLIFRFSPNITDSVVYLFFLEYQEYKMSIFGICFVLYTVKRCVNNNFSPGWSLKGLHDELSPACNFSPDTSNRAEILARVESKPGLKFTSCNRSLHFTVRNFEKIRNGQKYYHILKEHPKLSKIAKFGSEMF